MKKSKDTKRKIYLDYAASYEPNPGSIHILGMEQKKLLETARRNAAGFLNARPEEVIFTSGGTESNNIAILGTLKYVKTLHIVTTSIEHPSVLEACRISGADVTFVPVEANGVVDPKKIRKALKKNTVLVSVMYANNEIGTIQPIREIAKEIRHFKKENGTQIYFHTDAVQATNLEMNVERLGVDLLSLSGAKLPRGAGAGILFKRKSLTLSPVFGGGDQEQGIRPGTENVSAIAAMVGALGLIRKNAEKDNKKLSELKKYFISELERSNVLKNVRMNGDMENSLPNILNITLDKIPSDLIVIELSARGVYCSSKSACKSGEKGASHVLAAIYPEADPEIGGVRFSFREKTEKRDINYVVSALEEIFTKLKKWYTL